MSVLFDASALRALLDSGEKTESTYQNLLEERSELIPCGLDTLNHGVQWNSVISKFTLPDGREVDLAFVTKSSDTWRLVMIELENPARRIFVDSPHVDFHSDARGPIAQIEEWKTIVAREPASVRERLRPLVHMGPEWDTNPLEFRYVLVIGRNVAGRWSKERSGCIHRLRNERNIRLLSWDSLLRQMEASGGSRRNVLAHHRGGFRFKRAQAETLLFGRFHSDQIHLDLEQEKWFVDDRYDISSWRAGKLLVINQRYPEEKSDELFEAAVPHIASRGKPESK